MYYNHLIFNMPLLGVILLPCSSSLVLSYSKAPQILSFWTEYFIWVNSVLQNSFSEKFLIMCADSLFIMFYQIPSSFLKQGYIPCMSKVYLLDPLYHFMCLNTLHSSTCLSSVYTWRFVSNTTSS